MCAYQGNSFQVSVHNMGANELGAVSEFRFAVPQLDERSAEARSNLLNDSQQPPEKQEPGNPKIKKNPDGSIVQFNDKDQIEKITRTNGTVIECGYDQNGVRNRIIENKPSGRFIWTKDAGNDRWRSMQVVGAQRIKMSVAENGETAYENTLGGRITVRGDGSFRRVNLDNSFADVDAKGRADAVTLADGKRFQYKYDGDKVAALVETPPSGATIEWKQDENDSAVFRAGDRTRRHLQINEWIEHAFVELDRQQQVTEIRYLNGSLRQFTHENGRLKSVTDINTAGERETWTRIKDSDKWTNGTATDLRKDARVSVDGDYSYVEADGNRHIWRFEGTEDKRLATDVALGKSVEEARAKLLELAAVHLTDESDLTRFKGAIETFEARAKAQRLKEEQLATTYKELQKIFHPDEQPPFLSQTDRNDVAKQLMLHLARPRTIDQGFHNTCNVTSLQIVLAATKPEYVVNLVRQVANTGKYTTSQNVLVAPDAQSLQRDFESRIAKAYATSTGERTYASHLFQVAAVNSFYSAKQPHMVYRQQEPTAPDDTGERLIDTKNNTETSRQPELTNDMLAEISRQITGEDVAILSHTDLTDQRVMRFSTEQELREKVEARKIAGTLPAILMVHTRNDPFWKENGEGRAGGFGGWHVVTIWDIDHAGRILLDNQWGLGSDHEGLRRLPLSVVFGATRRP